MPRALLIVLDSVGIGGAADAATYGDAGADTLGHIAEACARGEGDRAGLRAGPLRLPNLATLGLGLAAGCASGRVPPGLAPFRPVEGAWGAGVETSRGKDTPSGHWEIAGLPVAFDWGYFPDTRPAFPAELTAALIRDAGLPGILGDCHASGTAIIEELGPEHVRTGRPICYTSVDSVFQIAAHEDRLRAGTALCRLRGGAPAHPAAAHRSCHRATLRGRFRERLHPHRQPQGFRHRAGGRDAARRAGRAGPAGRHRRQGRGHFRASPYRTRGQGHRQRRAPHRRARRVPRAAGWRTGLRQPDRFRQRIRPSPRRCRLCRGLGGAGPRGAHDPRRAFAGRSRRHHRRPWQRPDWRGSDHTRERVPILAFGPDVTPGSLGLRPTLADIGAGLADHLGLDWRGQGRSFLANGLRPPPH